MKATERLNLNCGSAIRYALVGICSNAIGYAVYLIATLLGGLNPKSAMTFVYCSVVLIGFLGNRAWTFQYSGKTSTTLVRYIAAHLIGYSINFMLLHIFTQILGYPHQIVQAVAIMIVALYLFTAFKYFVFPLKTRKS